MNTIPGIHLIGAVLLMFIIPESGMASVKLSGTNAISPGASFTDLPTVITAFPTNITVQSAEFSGNVTSDGGGYVTARGFVWGTYPQPTLEDSVITTGEGTGSFSSTLTGLDDNTDYYVRAYATNDSGTAYGANRKFTTLARPDPVFKTVAQDGTGDYTTVQQAFDDVPPNHPGPYTIFVRNGVYYEKLHLVQGKANVWLKGEHRDSTILTYDDYADIAGGTSNSYSVSIDADDFTATDITFQNTVPNDGSAPNQQAVALSVNGDRQAYYNVNILGYQDTFYARGAFGTGRIYIKNSLIKGSVDFIFGRNIVVFDSTRIHINRHNGIITAAATDAGSRYGFVFRDVEVSVDETGFDGNPVNTYYLGRPWQAAPRTVFINTYHPAQLHPEGWRTWNVEPAEYAEYNCMGPGCDDLSRRLPFSSQLTSEEAANYTLENIFSASSHIQFRDDWMPANPEEYTTDLPLDDAGSGLPSGYGLHQNYPNPFNPATTIRFDLPEHSNVHLAVYNLIGRRISVLVSDTLPPGRHQATWNAGSAASGVYVYRLTANGRMLNGKMILMK